MNNLIKPKITPQNLVDLLCYKWDLKLYGDRKDAQLKIARELLLKYEPELVYYTLENSHLYIKEGQNIYSLNYIPYIIDRAKEDRDKFSCLPEKISEAKKKREKEVKKLDKTTTPIHITLDVSKGKRKLKDPTEEELEDLFD